MKLLKCIVCRGEMVIVGNEKGVNKKVKCLNCGFSNEGGDIVVSPSQPQSSERKSPEVMVIRKRAISQE